MLSFVLVIFLFKPDSSTLSQEFFKDLLFKMLILPYKSSSNLSQLVSLWYTDNIFTPTYEYE